MMVYLVTCNKYKVIRELSISEFSELPAMCRAEEESLNDGYAVLAQHKGLFVADADGLYENPENENREYQCGYDRACGYFN